MKRQALLPISAFVIGASVMHAQSPQRIVSLVPAVTEMIFAFGDGRRLAGVSNYDTYPAEATRIERVGGLFDPSVERIFALRPDLVIVYNTQLDLKQRLDRVRIPYYVYEHRALADIMSTIRAIGGRIGSADRANALADQMERAIGQIRASVSRFPRPRTLLVFNRDVGSVRNINASGGYGFLHDMVEAAGGDNVFGDITQQLVQPSTEMLLTRRPDVIIELRYGEALKGGNATGDLEPWNALASVPAVRNRRIHVLTGDQFVVPGPRVVEATRTLARTIHPELPK